MGLRGQNPGRLDERIILFQPVKTIDGTTNNEAITYTEVATVHAERIFKGSTERFEAQQQVGVDTQEFRIRDYSTLYPITNQWQFTWDGVTYSITGIEKSGRRNYLILTGQSRDNA